MKNKEQILIVPVTHVSYIGNGFTGPSISTETSYTLYDSIGIYRPFYEVENKICFIRISAFVLIENEQGKFLMKELINKNKKPCYELGLHSYINSYSGNYKAIYNQLNYMLSKYFFNSKVNLQFIGNIRDQANTTVQSILGCIYYYKVDSNKFIPDENNHHTYNWYTVNEMIDIYNKTTSWSQIIIDMIVDNSIYKYIGKE